MRRRATRPLNRTAVKQANDAFYELHPELLRKDGTRIPLKPGDSRCSEWMKLYENNGGKFEGSSATRKPADPVMPCQDHKIVLELVTDDGYPIPEAAFRIECEGGPTKSGVLDRKGRQTIRGLPENTAFAVYYPGEDDIRAKAFAARLDEGLSQMSPEMVLGVLMQPASDLRAVASMLDRYFEGPLAQRCRRVFAGHQCLPVVENLLARAGFFDELILIQYDEGR